VTDVTNASRTLLMNIQTLDWDDELLSMVGVPRAMLPEIRPSSEIYGEAGIALEGVPVASVLGDQHAALVGQTCFAPGDAKCTYGTGSFLLLNTGQRPIASRSRVLTTLGYQLGSSPPTYALEGSIAVTGALVQWFRDNLGLIESAAEVEALLRDAADTAITSVNLFEVVDYLVRRAGWPEEEVRAALSLLIDETVHLLAIRLERKHGADYT